MVVLRGRYSRQVSLAVRVIPCLDVDNGRVVKGVNFVDLRDAGDPVEMAQIYDTEGADELTFLDITSYSSWIEQLFMAPWPRFVAAVAAIGFVGYLVLLKRRLLP